MILVIFEFIVLENKEKDYFREVEKLQLELKQTKGFISVDRFIHSTKKNYYVSVSTWKNENAVKAWKANSKHIISQKIGKKEIFKSFRIRVAEVIRDYSNKD
jgi:heme-degrading monooxygenase HmoA